MNATTTLNETLLQVVRDNDIKGVKTVLNNGADVHAWNDDPLQWAFINKHTDIVKLLLAHGADKSALN